MLFGRRIDIFALMTLHQRNASLDVKRDVRVFSRSESYQGYKNIPFSTLDASTKLILNWSIQFWLIISDKFTFQKIS